MKRFTLCADDYGQNTPISQGILELIKQKKLTATSCMTNMLHWPVAAKDLTTLQNQVKIGLHFNLTEGPAAKHPELFCKNNQLIIRAFTHKLDKRKIKEELLAQIDLFKTHIGRLPDFIDGHQHIHHLPIIRDALVDVYQETFPDKKSYIRVSANPILKAIKQSLRCPKILIIALTGAYRLKRKLVKLNIPHNNSFSGIYNLSPDSDYKKLFQIFLNEINEDGLIMCHPGLQSDDTADGTRHARWNEFQLLQHL